MGMNNSLANYKLPELKNILYISLAVIILSVVSYYYIDIPVAKWGYYETREHSAHLIWQYATYLAPFYYNSAPWFIFYVIARVIFNRPLESWHKAGLIIIICMAANGILIEQLKYVFGRYWASTWYHGNLSLIQDGKYGFTWFNAQHGYNSFPSGHTAVTFTVMTAAAWQYNNVKFNLFAAFNCLAIAAGLILMCYHYVSDILIGGLVGSLVSYFVLYSYQKYSKK